MEIKFHSKWKDWIMACDLNSIKFKFFNLIQIHWMEFKLNWIQNCKTEYPERNAQSSSKIASIQWGVYTMWMFITNNWNSRWPMQLSGEMPSYFLVLKMPLLSFQKPSCLSVPLKTTRLWRQWKVLATRAEESGNYNSKSWTLTILKN